MKTKRVRPQQELKGELVARRVPLTTERRPAYELSMQILHKYIQIALDEIRAEKVLAGLGTSSPVGNRGATLDFDQSDAKK
jgi:hypothetical protein